MFKKSMLLGALFVCLPSVALAQEGDDVRLKFGVTGGTLGAGPEVSYRFGENIGIRANATYFSVSTDVDSDDLTYDANVKLKSGGAMVDLYPFGGGFRLSGGLRYNGNKGTAAAISNDGEGYDIGGTYYTLEEIGTLNAETKIKEWAPSATLGFGGGLSKGLAFGIEAGVLFQGAVEVAPLTYTGTCDATSCATLVADLEAERLSINDDIDDYKLYPILQFSLGYRF